MLPFRSGGGGPRFRLFGFPIRIDWSFFVIAVILGLRPGVTAIEMVTWVGVVFVSVLVHEFGHAFAARAVGADSISIELRFDSVASLRTGLGETCRALSRSVCHLPAPLPGLRLGAIALAVAHALDVSTSRAGDNVVLFMVLWVNFVWGLLNLLPVLPLDGGMVMQNLLPGDPVVRARRGAMVSLAVCIVGGVYRAVEGFHVRRALCRTPRFLELQRNRSQGPTDDHPRSDHRGRSRARSSRRR